VSFLDSTGQDFDLLVPPEPEPAMSFKRARDEIALSEAGAAATKRSKDTVVAAEDATIQQSSIRRVYLTAVPDSDAEACRSAGGRWDGSAGRWFVRVGLGLEPFEKWLPSPEVLCTCKQPAAKLTLGGETTVFVCSQRFGCKFLQREDGEPASFEQLIPGYSAKAGTNGLTGFCWSYLLEGTCGNVKRGNCCCLKHATAKTRTTAMPLYEKAAPQAK
jgi:Domain of unknown function (DUF5710)